MELGSESGTVAFRSDMRQLDKGLISLTAMINRSNHGTVYFGVDDTGYVSGLQVDAPLFDKIRYTARKNILPRLIIDVVEHVSTDGKSYVSVSASGFETPYSYDGRYYVRNSVNDDMATPETISRLVLARRFDAMR
ncbi:MAG: ATP-binding protein, partial [Candidatus Methanomethylophilus sp.]|nr:ATP-binding protein [Methanomethylophilus sp.]